LGHSPRGREDTLAAVVLRRLPPLAFVCGAVLAALATALRAWRAHGAPSVLDPEGLRLFDAAMTQLQDVGLGLLAAGLLGRVAPSRLAGLAALGFLASCVLFCGDVFPAAFRDDHATLGTAPVGGSFGIAAWLVLAAAGLASLQSGRPTGDRDGA